MERSNLLVYACLLFFVAKASATQFMVGGPNGWTVPSPNTVSYNQWAELNRFQIGDSLVFVYPKGKDSVLVVHQDAYDTCNTSSYIKRFDDGNSVFTFDRSGPFFFISGMQDNCLKKEALIVVVLANRTRQSNSQPSSSTPTMPPLSPPAIAPTPAEFATPPPNGESVPAIPPSGADNDTNPSTAPSPIGEDTNSNIPSAAPSGEENPNTPPPSPNGASLNIVSFIGSTGPLLALIMLMI